MLLRYVYVTANSVAERDNIIFLNNLTQFEIIFIHSILIKC